MRSPKRVRSSVDAGRPVPEIRSMMASPADLDLQSAQHQPSIPLGSLTFGHSSEYSLTALSMAAEYQALQGALPEPSVQREQLPTPLPSQAGTIARTIEEPHTMLPPDPDMHIHGTIGDTLDSLTSFLNNEPLNSYHFASLINTEQPMPFFSPESFNYGQDVPPGTETITAPTPANLPIP